MRNGVRVADADTVSADAADAAGIIPYSTVGWGVFFDGIRMGIRLGERIPILIPLNFVFLVE